MIILFFLVGIYFAWVWFVLRGAACFLCGGRYGKDECKCGRPR